MFAFAHKYGSGSNRNFDVYGLLNEEAPFYDDNDNFIGYIKNTMAFGLSVAVATAANQVTGSHAPRLAIYITA